MDSKPVPQKKPSNNPSKDTPLKQEEDIEQINHDDPDKKEPMKIEDPGQKESFRIEEPSPNQS